MNLCVNVRDLDLEGSAADYTAFVHVQQNVAERAAWLAVRFCQLSAIS